MDKLQLGRNLFLILTVLLFLKLFDLNNFLSSLGWTILVGCITWNVIKLINKYFDNEVISTKGKAVVVTGKYECLILSKLIFY